MKILAIDTSNQVMGVGVSDGDQVLGEITTNMKKNHSVRLMPAIETMLTEVGIGAAELDAIAVAHGPGSYTGVRIGVTVAKTMAWSLGIGLAGVSSLEVLAQNGRRFEGMISPIFDARRGQVYTGLYQGCPRPEKVLGDQILQLTDWLEGLKSYDDPILFLGEDQKKHRDTITSVLGEQACFAATEEQTPRPGALALLAGRSFDDERAVHHFVPEYAQLAEAESKWLASQES